jgi:hypothetical protein
MAMTRAASALIVDHTLGLTAYAAPAGFIGLHTRSPGPTGIVTGEPSGNGYARVAITGKMGATDTNTCRSTNTGTISFPVPSGAWAGGLPLRHWAMHSASSGGIVLLYGELDVERIVLANEFPPNFPPGSFRIDALFDGLSDLTKSTAAKWLDHFLNIAAYTMPTAVSLRLYSADPTSAGSTGSELSGGGYAPVTVIDTYMAAAEANGIAVNDTVVDFPMPTGTWNVVAYALYHAAAARILMRKVRHKELTLLSGDPVLRISRGQLALRGL